MERRARKAADRICGRFDARHLSARQHVDPGIRRAECARRSRHPRSSTRAIISPASGIPTAWAASSMACRGTSTPVSCFTGAICSRKPALRCRRDPGPNGSPCWRRSSNAAFGISTASYCRRMNRSRSSHSRCSRTIRCCATMAATAISKVPDSGARSSSTSTCFAAATRRRRPMPTCRTSGTNSVAAISVFTFPAHGTSANFSADCRRTFSRAG